MVLDKKNIEDNQFLIELSNAITKPQITNSLFVNINTPYWVLIGLTDKISTFKELEFVALNNSNNKIVRDIVMRKIKNQSFSGKVSSGSESYMIMYRYRNSKLYLSHEVGFKCECNEN